MKLRQWFRRLCYFFKIKPNDLPQYLIDLIPKPPLRYSTCFLPLPNFKVRTELFRNLFFPCTVNKWNNLDNIIKPSESYLMFRKRILNLIRPKCNEKYGIPNPAGLKHSHKNFNVNLEFWSWPERLCVNFLQNSKSIWKYYNFHAVITIIGC